MIYLSADDYGLCREVSEHIRECENLNKISTFVNFKQISDDEFLKQRDVALHINLVEGRPLSDPEEIPLLTDRNGFFRHTFAGLLLLSLIRRKEFKAQAEKEISAQLEAWKRLLPQGAPLLVDSHQHTHMVPALFQVLMRRLRGENVKYLRIPAEPVMPYVMTPSLYFTYNIKNIIKQWLLKFLWQINKKEYKKHNFPTAYFFGVLFSGEMDAKRVGKVLPKYINLAKRRGRDIEILFHPGYATEPLPQEEIQFKSFYASPNRKTENEAARNFKI